MRGRGQTGEKFRAPGHPDEPAYCGGEEHEWELREGELCGNEVCGCFVGEENC